jgi:hypothetical protein
LTATRAAVPLQQHTVLYRSTRGKERDCVGHTSKRDRDIILEVVGFHSSRRRKKKKKISRVVGGGGERRSTG